MRVNTAYVSAYQRARVHQARYVRGEVFTLEVNANAVLAADAAIESVVFRVDNPGAVIFGAASKTDRTASVRCTAGAGFAQVKAELTADDGQIVTQLFEIGAHDAPYFQDETAPAAGATTATA